MLQISADLALPDEFVTEPLAIVARRGRGKTYTGLVLAEEMLQAGQQIVALDPMDVWWGLRTSADGKSDGFPVVIFGGDHADVKLEPSMGKDLADFLVSENAPAIIVPDFEDNQQVVEFMTPFLGVLLRANKDPLHVLFDEAEAFAPERPAKYEARMLGAMGRLVKRGRVRGLGCTLITQRTASLNKNVLTQVGGIFALGLSAPWDRVPIEAWVKTNGSAAQIDEFLAELAGLPIGDGYFWHPDWDIFKRIHVRKRSTFDSSATPKPGQRKMVPKSWSEIDVAKLNDRLQEAVERTREEDPEYLRGRIWDLERQLRSVSQNLAAPKRVEVPVEIEVPVIDYETAERMREIIATVAQAAAEPIEELEERITKAVNEALAPLMDQHGRWETAFLRGELQGPVQRTPQPQKTPSLTLTAPAPTRAPAQQTDVSISRPQQAILDALAWFEAVGLRTPRRSPLAAVAGVSPKSSGFEKNVSTLRTAGLIEYPQIGLLTLTTDGRAIARSPTIEPREEDLQASIYRMVSGPQATLLKVLVDLYPQHATREELATFAGVSAASSGFEKNVSTLRSFGLIDYPGVGQVRAMPMMFLNS